MLIRDVTAILNGLRGIICVYKPAELSVTNFRKALITRICSELNDLDVQLRMPTNNLELEESVSKQLGVLINPDLTDHPLLTGPRFEEEYFPVSWSNYLGWNTSGVLIFGLKSGTQTAKYIRENRSTRAYRIKGVLGQATENGFESGKVVERSTWRHIKHIHMDRMLCSMQASHQKKMFEMCGVDMQSQQAYELAVKGPIRPADSKIPVIYGLKCIEFEGPNFTLEVQCVNEYEAYLAMLIHEIGIKLHSTAYCKSIKCIRHSCFTLDHALLQKHWNLRNIAANLEMCQKLLSENEDLVRQTSVALR